MAILAKIQTKKVDLIEMIKKSVSLRARFDGEQMCEYVEKVKKMDLEEQKKIYAVLIEEQKNFEKLKKEGEEIVSNFNKSAQKIVNKIIAESQINQRALDSNEADNILNALVNV